MSNGLEERARAYAALGEPSRLAIIDRLAHGDLASGELAAELGLPTNLMAHHLQVLEQAGLVERRRSEGDGRRAYVRRTATCNRLLGSDATPRPHRVAFVCSANSARSPARRGLLAHRQRHPRGPLPARTPPGACTRVRSRWPATTASTWQAPHRSSSTTCSPVTNC